MNNPYIDYYNRQVGGGDFDVFRGSPVQYGYGLGSFFSSLFRKVVPLISRGARYITPKLAKAATTLKPHLITAAKDVASGVMQDVGQKISSLIPTPKQEGGGRRKRRRHRSQSTRKNKTKRLCSTASLLKRFHTSQRKKKRKTNIKNIFL